jgi:hypothetical protein
MPPRKTIVIQPLGFDAPVTAAAKELERYLPKLANVAAKARPARAVIPEGRPVDIVLGVCQHLADLGLGALPVAHDDDDALAIIPKAGKVYLAGSNPRSVLFAAYRLLEELGAVFLRPGPRGEILPRRAGLSWPKRPIREQASYRHRGICIEGAPRLDHVLDLLDWMAKKKMNAFQLQFRHAGVFWRRGYQGAEMDPASQKSRLSEADCLALDDRVIARVKELGMVLHRVGHGWTSYAVGVPGLGWETTAQQPPADKRDWLAEVGGRRGLWHGVAANTELCYSRPEVREAFVQEVLTYARQHCQVDLLHVWMSDSYNNKCECAECRKRSPSDWYALLVDEIGRRLKAERLPTRIVFLGYVDLLWPPAEVRYTTDNVVFMYAPIHRCFRHPLTESKCDQPAPRARPPLNQCRLPATNRFYADIAGEWTKAGVPDSFVFDYHLMWAVWRDGLGADLGAVMARDIQDLEPLGFRGFMSCQCTRAFYPLPYLPSAMADMLWNRRQPARAHRRKVMSSAFGKHADEVERYFAGMVRAFRLGPDLEHKTVASDLPAAGATRIGRIASSAEEAQRRFTAAAKRESEPAVRLSLELVALHAEQAAAVARAYLAGLKGDKQALAAIRASHEKRMPAILRDYSPWVDPLVAGPVREALAAAERLV